MVTSWIEQVNQFKSPLRVAAGFLLRSRESKVAKSKQLRDQRDQLKKALERTEKQIQDQQEEIARLKRQVENLEIRQADSSKQAILLPSDPSVGKQGYGARMVSLAVNLARSVGLRGAARAIEIFFSGLASSRRRLTRRQFELGWRGSGLLRSMNRLSRPTTGFGWPIIPIK